MTLLKDHLKIGMEILFVGFNPSLRSSETGHHYANPSNRFWKILFQSGLTPRLYDSTIDDKLLDLGYGLTNIVERPTKAADEITSREFAEGRKILYNKINHYKPNVVCFVGKGVYQAYRKVRKTHWGFQSESAIEGIKEFVAPSSSGLVRMPMDEIVSIYSELSRKNEE